MGCSNSKKAPVEVLAVRYTKANLPQPFSADYENEFEK